MQNFEKSTQTNCNHEMRSPNFFFPKKNIRFCIVTIATKLFHCNRVHHGYRSQNNRAQASKQATPAYRDAQLWIFATFKHCCILNIRDERNRWFNRPGARSMCATIVIKYSVFVCCDKEPHTFAFCSSLCATSFKYQLFIKCHLII